MHKSSAVKDTSKSHNHIGKLRGGARVFAWGGGAQWQNVSLITAPALKKALSGGGGGGDPTHFSRPKIVVA